VLVYVHWAWFLQPHLAAAWILWRHPARFGRAAAMTAAAFDLGAVLYYLVPTAPPWWAAEHGRLEGVRRIMVEVGKRFWGRFWRPLYDFLGGNPVAAMPSLHFATSVMAAHVLSDIGPVAGAVGWTYAVSLGFALVYLGEHYLVDLLAGLALTELVVLAGPRVAPALRSLSSALQELEGQARS
jgi:membrane-associated phospholipid phosphatase